MTSRKIQRLLGRLGVKLHFIFKSHVKQRMFFSSAAQRRKKKGGGNYGNVLNTRKIIACGLDQKEEHSVRSLDRISQYNTQYLDLCVVLHYNRSPNCSFPTFAANGRFFNV